MKLPLGAAVAAALFLCASIASAIPAARIQEIDALVEARFSYALPPEHLPDPENISSLRAVRAGRAWTGDCDDLAITTLDALRQSGVGKDRMKALFVAVVEDGRVLGFHLIGVVADDEGREWVVGDTMTTPFPAAALPATPYVVLETRPFARIRVVRR